MLYVIGLGLGDPKDVTVKGLEIIKKCESVFLEAYTSILTAGQESLEAFYEKKVILADRDMVEQGSDMILDAAVNSDVAFLVVGDPFGATTHTDLILRAKEKEIPVQIIHNASIINAVGCCGLQLYSFGETVSIPFWTDSWQPDSFYDRIVSNQSRGLHTLCLLDIKVKEPTLESMTKKKKIYQPPRFMTVNEAAQQLLSILAKKGNVDVAYTKETKCVGLARVGSETQRIVYCSLEKMADSIDIGGPLHSLIIPGCIQPLEEEFLQQFLQ